MSLSIRSATSADISLIGQFIRDLAEYEKLAHEVRFDEAVMAQKLFGPRPFAEVLIGEIDGTAQGFALFFHNFSTFEGRPGIYLEDLFVRPEARGSGLGKALLQQLAADSQVCILKIRLCLGHDIGNTISPATILTVSLLITHAFGE